MNFALLHQDVSSSPLNLVVHASPSHPPHSLLWLAGKQGLGAETACHVHSDCMDVVSADAKGRLAEFFPDSEVNSEGGKRSRMKLTVIWRGSLGRDPVLSSPSSIRGEVNIARLVGRRFFGYDQGKDPGKDYRVDEVNWLFSQYLTRLHLPYLFQILDDCHTMVTWGSESDRSAFTKKLDGMLPKNGGGILGGDGLDFVDFAVWSAMANAGMADGCSGKTKDWAKRCAAAAGVPKPLAVCVMENDCTATKKGKGNNNVIDVITIDD